MQPIEIAWQSYDAGDSLASSVMHFHTCCEFMYITEGAVKLIASGVPYTVSEGKLAVIPAFVMHEAEALRNPYSRTCFRCEVDRQQLRYLPPELASLLRSSDSSPIHIFHLSDAPDVSALIMRIFYEYTSPASFQNEFLQGLLLTLLISLYRIDPLPFSIKDDKMEEYRLFIESNFKEKITIDTIAAKFFMSTPYFITKFKQYTGFSPNHYRSLCRLAHAKKLLMENKLSLSEIADACGFSDTNSFIRTFRQAMQITPIKYRERYLHNPNFDT